MCKVLRLHPFLFAWYPIMYIGSLNVNEISLRQIIIPNVIIFFVVIMMVSFLYYIVKDLAKSLVICSVLLINLFLFGPLTDALYFIIPQFSDYLEWGSGAILLTFSGGGIYKIYVAKQSIQKLNVMFFIIGFTLMLQPIWLLYHEGLQYRLVNYFNKSASNSTQESGVEIVPEKYNAGMPLTIKPNVYYIIVDGYPRQDVLENHYGFSNATFLEYLNHKGFYVAKDSHSNYPVTDYSLASSLNMQHVNEIAFSNGPNKVRLFHDLIRKPKVAEQFKALGYEYITISSGWGPTLSRSPISDTHYMPYYSKLHPFYKIILRMTPFRFFLSTTEAKHSLYSLEKIEDISKNKAEGAFVFLHLLMPHPPYCFEENGNVRHYTFSESFGQKDLFLGQLSFLNKKLESLFDTILKNSEVHPIIILQGDHGTSSVLENNKVGPASEEGLNERFSILNAYYAPESIKSKLYSSITPVNSFRIVFNSYFDLDYELLDDSSYFSWYYADKSFQNVTDRLD